MHNGSRNISSTRWFSFFGIYVAVLSLLLLWSNRVGNTALVNLSFFTIFVSFACTFCPLPILWLFLWISRDYNPFLIALTGSVATCIANLNDYYILNSLLRWKKLARAKDSRWYKRSAAWFSRYPFWTLTIANVLPLPVDFVRLLAISTGYSRVPFTLANFLGRYPRYLILAGLGYQLKLSNKVILIVLLVTVTIAVVKSYPKLREKLLGREENRQESGDSRQDSELNGGR
jgi:membrane protein YqaA with SNARE-associated domain